MPKKPQDILHFLRNKSAPAPEVPVAVVRPEPPSEGGVERTRRMILLRRSQVIVASVAVALLVVLAYMVGSLGTGGRAAAQATANTSLRIHVIRAITYDKTSTGKMDADILSDIFNQMGLSSQVIGIGGKLAVVVGAWHRDPSRDPEAQKILEKVLTWEDKGGTRHCSDAYFTQIER